MLGLFLAFAAVVGKVLLGATFPAATLAALELLFAWYVLCSMGMGLYGLYSVCEHVAQSYNKLWALIFGLMFVGVIWGAHYGALLYGTWKLINLFTIGFNWFRFAGGVFLLILGYCVQAAEMKVFWDRIRR